MASNEKFYLRCVQEGQPDLYLHYDPYKDAYVVGATLKGACIVTKEQLGFWMERLGPQWAPVPIDATCVKTFKLPQL